MFNLNNIFNNCTRCTNSGYVGNLTFDFYQWKFYLKIDYCPKCRQHILKQSEELENTKRQDGPFFCFD